MGIKERLLNRLRKPKQPIENGQEIDTNAGTTDESKLKKIREKLPKIKPQEKIKESLGNFHQSNLEKIKGIKEKLPKIKPPEQIKERLGNFHQSNLEKIRGIWEKLPKIKQSATENEVIEKETEIKETEIITPETPTNGGQFQEIIKKLKKTAIPRENSKIEQVYQELEQKNWGRIKVFFNKYLEQVKQSDLENIKQNINQNLEKMKRGQIEEIWPKIQGLAKMIADPKAAWKSKAMAIAALVYLISPFDAIPDVIPFVGLADDAILIITVVSTLGSELEKYLTRQAEIKAEIEIRKYNRIVRITLMGSIAAAILAIVVKLIYNQL